MTCNPLNNTLKLENVDQWDKTPSKNDYAFKQKLFSKNDSKPESLFVYKDGECIFANKERVRIRLGADEALPYGQCGGAPAMWFSLWVNKKKVLSKYVYNPQCNPGNILESVQISNETIMFNQYKITGDFALYEIDKNIVTSEIVAIKNDIPIDTIEYPEHGEKIPAGTKILLHGENNPVCKAFAKDDWNTQIEQKSYQNGCDYSANSLTSYTSLIDINNDGLQEREYVDSRWGRFEYTDIYLIDENASKAIDTLLEKLPTNIGYNPKEREQCQEIVEAIKATNVSPIPKSWADGDNITLRSINKTVTLPHDIETITYEGKNYFYFLSDGIYGLLEYQSNHSFNEICIAKKVEENY
jgi:hypothetical protein